MDARTRRAFEVSDEELRVPLIIAISALNAALTEQAANAKVDSLADRIARLASLLADIDNDAARREQMFREEG